MNNTNENNPLEFKTVEQAVSELKLGRQDKYCVYNGLLCRRTIFMSWVSECKHDQGQKYNISQHNPIIHKGQRIRITSDE